jgi:hypothetical protein
MNHNKIRLLNLDFFKTYTIYKNIFGYQNVYVIPYELLNNDPAKFASELGRVIEAPSDQIRRLLLKGTPRNTRKHEENLYKKVRRHSFPNTHFRNFMASGLCNFLKRVAIKATKKTVLKETRLSPAMRDKIIKKYESSNAQLSRKLSLDLQSLGYF